MKIATWNVNSVRSRLPHVLDWLRETSPDVVLLQEIKVVEELFPFEAIEDLNYNIAVYGQKTYNGVGILSKFPLEDVTKGIPGGAEDPQARYIEAVTGGVRVASVYVPNGQAVGSEKFAYKLSFFADLQRHLTTLMETQEMVFIGGDFNVTVDDQDVYDPVGWREEILCSTQERQAIHQILQEGYIDTVRSLRPQETIYSWWDYRQGSFHKNHGLRIDHILASPALTGQLKEAGVDVNVRRLEKPSDHAPVWLVFER